MKCWICEGTGVVTGVHNPYTGVYNETKECPACGGTGIVPAKKWPTWPYVQTTLPDDSNE